MLSNIPKDDTHKYIRLRVDKKQVYFFLNFD